MWHLRLLGDIHGLLELLLPLRLWLERRILLNGRHLTVLWEELLLLRDSVHLVETKLLGLSLLLLKLHLLLLLLLLVFLQLLSKLFNLVFQGIHLDALKVFFFGQVLLLAF